MKATLKQYLVLLVMLLLFAGLLAVLPESPLQHPALPTAGHDGIQQSG